MRLNTVSQSLVQLQIDLTDIENSMVSSYGVLIPGFCQFLQAESIQFHMSPTENQM
jgi:hypothetical protein